MASWRKRGAAWTGISGSTAATTTGNSSISASSDWRAKLEKYARTCIHGTDSHVL